MVQKEQKDYAGNLERELRELHQLEQMDNEIDARGTFTVTCSQVLTLICC